MKELVITPADILVRLKIRDIVLRNVSLLEKCNATDPIDKNDESDRFDS